MHTALLSGSPILDVDATFLIYIGLFFLLFFLLRAFVFQPMMALFEERDRAIVGAKKEARELERSAEDKLLAFEDEMAKVRSEAGTERDRLRAEGARLERNLIEKVRGEADAMIADAETQMAAEAEKVRRDIAATSPVLARQIAEKLLGRQVSG